MKKLIIGLICLSFLVLNGFSYVNAEKSIDTEREAIQTMHNFLDENSNVDESWADFEIVGHEKLYDGNLDDYGYVFELAKSDERGYGIVVDNDSSYVVVEASPDSPSPYSEYGERYNKVYTTALNYYVSDKYVRSNTLIDVRKETILTVDDLSVKRMTFEPSVSLMQSSSTFANTTDYLDNYSTKFEFVTQQTNTQACIPASFTMALIYWDNIGKISVCFDGTNAEMKESLFDYMENVGGSIAVSARTAQEGIEDWTSEYCSDFYITIEIDNFSPTMSEFANLSSQISSNNPLVVMFYGGVITTGTVQHATCMVGYVSRDTGNNYVIVSDPWETTENTKYVVYNTDNVYGYFILERNSFAG